MVGMRRIRLSASTSNIAPTRPAGSNVLDGKGQTSGGELRTYDFQETGPDIHKDNTQNAPVPQQNQLPGPVIERTKPTVSPQRRLEFNQQVEQHDLIWGQTEFTTPGP